MAAKIVDMTGKRYGSLVAIQQSGRNSSRGAVWEFVCDCGTLVTTNGSEVRKGGVTSCAECAKIKRRTNKLTHGMCNTKEYAAWVAMKRRCTNRNSFAYSEYGGRGIAVCDRWNQFVNFLADMGSKPSASHTLDRIDVNGNYEPSNCRWATRREQANNKRNNRIVTVNGVPQTLSEAARQLGIGESTLRKKLNKERIGG